MIHIELNDSRTLVIVSSTVKSKLSDLPDNSKLSNDEIIKFIAFLKDVFDIDVKIQEETVLPKNVVNLSLFISAREG